MASENASVLTTSLWVAIPTILAAISITYGVVKHSRNARGKENLQDSKSCRKPDLTTDIITDLLNRLHPQFIQYAMGQLFQEGNYPFAVRRKCKEIYGESIFLLPTIASFEKDYTIWTEHARVVMSQWLKQHDYAITETNDLFQVVSETFLKLKVLPEAKRHLADIMEKQVE